MPSVKLPGFPLGSRVKGVDGDGDGTVVVTVMGTPSTWHPYTWKNGTAKQLPVLAGAANAQVTEISNGYVIGDALDSDFHSTAVLWNKDGKVTALPNGDSTTAINSQGLILGSNKKLVSGLWQLTTDVGAAPSDGRVYTLGDDGTPAGAKALAGTTYPRFPAVWRCG
ncbi:hypothetical protein OH738_09425 [Streptomyces hirsutus]|uniref:hypothetical protein n=1 Tax=Streptomyces hirsutus TaxID=35620 RepID=UPI003865A2C6|nr:hypothetical protein OH738_09425 [Streptomyces hirsutus]